MHRSRLLAAGLAGYLLGTIPSADIASRCSGGPDLRSAGSGNPGAANARRVLGTNWGLAVMTSDVAKAVAACMIGGRLAGRGRAGDLGRHVGGVGAVLGHCYPVWNGFKGGKGVACGIGQCLATFPAFVPVDIAVAIASSMSPTVKRRAFAATAMSSATWVLGALWWWKRRLPNWWGPEPTVAMPLAAIASSAVVLERFANSRPPIS